MPISTPADPALARVAARLEQLADHLRAAVSAADRAAAKRELEMLAAAVMA